MLLGFAFIAVGIGLAFIWPQEFFFVLKGTLILGLLVLGLINVLIGLSKQKAKRDFAKGLHDDLGEDSNSAAGDSSAAPAPPV